MAQASEAFKTQRELPLVNGRASYDVEESNDEWESGQDDGREREVEGGDDESDWNIEPMEMFESVLPDDSRQGDETDGFVSDSDGYEKQEPATSPEPPSRHQNEHAKANYKANAAKDVAGEVSSDKDNDMNIPAAKFSIPETAPVQEDEDNLGNGSFDMTLRHTEPVISKKSKKRNRAKPVLEAQTTGHNAPKQTSTGETHTSSKKRKRSPQGEEELQGPRNKRKKPRLSKEQSLEKKQAQRARKRLRKKQKPGASISIDQHDQLLKRNADSGKDTTVPQEYSKTGKKKKKGKKKNGKKKKQPNDVVTGGEEVSGEAPRGKEGLQKVDRISVGKASHPESRPVRGGEENTETSHGSGHMANRKAAPQGVSLNSAQFPEKRRHRKRPLPTESEIDALETRNGPAVDKLGADVKTRDESSVDQPRKKSRKRKSRASLQLESGEHQPTTNESLIDTRYATEVEGSHGGVQVEMPELAKETEPGSGKNKRKSKTGAESVLGGEMIEAQLPFEKPVSETVDEANFLLRGEDRNGKKTSKRTVELPEEPIAAEHAVGSNGIAETGKYQESTEQLPADADIDRAKNKKSKKISNTLDGEMSDLENDGVKVRPQKSEETTPADVSHKKNSKSTKMTMKMAVEFQREGSHQNGQAEEVHLAEDILPAKYSTPTRKQRPSKNEKQSPGHVNFGDKEQQGEQPAEFEGEKLDRKKSSNTSEYVKSSFDLMSDTDAQASVPGRSSRNYDVRPSTAASSLPKQRSYVTDEASDNAQNSQQSASHAKAKVNGISVPSIPRPYVKGMGLNGSTDVRDSEDDDIHTKDDWEDDVRHANKLLPQVDDMEYPFNQDEDMYDVDKEDGGSALFAQFANPEEPPSRELNDTSESEFGDKAQLATKPTRGLRSAEKVQSTINLADQPQGRLLRKNIQEDVTNNDAEEPHEDVADAQDSRSPSNGSRRQGQKRPKKTFFELQDIAKSSDPDFWDELPGDGVVTPAIPPRQPRGAERQLDLHGNVMTKYVTPFKKRGRPRKSLAADETPGTEPGGTGRKSAPSRKDRNATPKNRNSEQPTPPSYKGGRWDDEEMKRLFDAVEDCRKARGLTETQLINMIHTPQYPKNVAEFWEPICLAIPERQRGKVMDMTRRHFNSFVARGTWTREEDETLRDLVHRFGHQWTRIAGLLNRYSRDVIDRYRNYGICGDAQRLNQPWTEEEEVEMVEQYMRALDFIKEDRAENPSKYTTDEPDSALVDWQVLSENMGRRRSRHQLRIKWNSLNLHFTGSETLASRKPASDVSWILEKARNQLRRMTDDDKYQLVFAIRESKAGEDSKIPWPKLVSKQYRLKWHNKTLRLLWKRLRETIPGWEDKKSRDIAAALVLKYDDQQAFNEVDDSEANDEGESTYLAPRAKAKSGTGKEKTARSEGFVEDSEVESEDEETGNGEEHGKDDTERILTPRTLPRRATATKALSNFAQQQALREDSLDNEKYRDESRQVEVPIESISETKPPKKRRGRPPKNPPREEMFIHYESLMDAAESEAESNSESGDSAVEIARQLTQEMAAAIPVKRPRGRPPKSTQKATPMRTATNTPMHRVKKQEEEVDVSAPPQSSTSESSSKNEDSHVKDSSMPEPPVRRSLRHKNTSSNGTKVNSNDSFDVSAHAASEDEASLPEPEALASSPKATVRRSGRKSSAKLGSDGQADKIAGGDQPNSSINIPKPPKKGESTLALNGVKTPTWGKGAIKTYTGSSAMKKSNGSAQVLPIKTRPRAAVEDIEDSQVDPSDDSSNQSESDFEEDEEIPAKVPEEMIESMDSDPYIPSNNI